MPLNLSQLGIQVFVDGADIATMALFAKRDDIAGFTTNPSLMKKAGVENYREFAKMVLAAVGGKEISFEVFADDWQWDREAERQAREIAMWGSNVFVKIPIVSRRGVCSYDLIYRLAKDGIKVNVTAVLGVEQVKGIEQILNPRVPAIVSVFAGRVMDTGCDPCPIVQHIASSLIRHGCTRVLWASTRKVQDIAAAVSAGAHVITVSPVLLLEAMRPSAMFTPQNFEGVSPEALGKPGFIGLDLAEYSRRTVQQFWDDAQGITF